MQPRDDGVSLRDFFERMIVEHQRVHDVERRSLDGAADGITQRLEEMNKFRAQLDVERANYVTREMFDTRVRPIERLVWGILALVGAAVVAVPVAVSIWLK